ncbi:MAG: FG-GAP repeat protein, partial [Deltaproteobacteria bacterium]|nr:FG-GAP repeat protein [Deltaproteobacteria bacterium]
MDGFTIAQGRSIYSESNTAWKIIATGDFNGDGKVDILWRNDQSGQVYMMLMDGFTIIEGRSIYSEFNTDWKIIGATP